MDFDLADLPDDVETLQRMVRSLATERTDLSEAQAVVKAARAAQPSLSVLFVSGYADSKALEAAMGSAPFLRKPFRPAELALAVRNAIEQGQPPASSNNK
jgi:DNA-binding NtrC family response regulator